MKRIISLAFMAVLLVGIFVGTAFTVSADPALTVSDECITILKAYEGFCKYPYWDYGQWTVGYGTRCPADKLDTYKENGITEEEAEALLRTFVADYEDDLNYFSKKYNLSTTQNQFDAMFLFSYNCGSGWIYSTSSNFHKAMANPNAEPAEVLYQFGTWSNAGDSPMVGLIKRRMAEANMYLNGVYSKNRPANYCYVIYESGGGEIEDCVHAYNVDAGAATPLTPVLSGFTFEGWYTEQNGGTQVTSLTADTDGITLYARWKGDGTLPEGSEGSAGTKLENPVTVKVTADELNLRKGPGTNYAPLTYVVKGDSITITATTQDEMGRLWGYSDKGWACLEFTNYAAVVGGQEQPEPEPEQPSEPVPPVTEEGQVGTVIANGCLYIREGPGSTYKKVGEYASKARICILEQRSSGISMWGRTDKGWVSMTYVRLDTAGGETESPADQDGAKAVNKASSKIYGITGSYKKPSTSILDQVIGGAQNQAGTTNQDSANVNQNTPQPQEGKLGTVCAESTLNIRSGAGSSYATSGFYRNGDRVVILEETVIGAARWGRTDKGWVNMSYVELDETEESNQRTVTATYLNIRETADVDGKIVGYLNAGDQVTILETKVVDDCQWGRIQAGWIALAYTE